MKEYIVAADKKPDFKFTGEIIAISRTSPDQANYNFSGDAGRWQVLTLYKTKSSKFVCNRVNYSNWVGEKDYSGAQVCESIDDVKKFFGQSLLAKQLYNKASIDNFIEI